MVVVHVRWEWTGKSDTRSHNVIDCLAVRTGSWFRGISEGEAGRVDDPVISNKRHGDLSDVSGPRPPLSNLRDVWDYTEKTFLTLVHGLTLDISQPDLEIRSEVFSRQLKHLHVSSSISDTYELRESHVSDCADQLNWTAIMDVSVFDSTHGLRSIKDFL